MRALLIIDNLKNPAARADLDKLARHLDPRRIQLTVCALRADEGDINLGIKTRLDPRLCVRLFRLIREQDIELIHLLEPGFGLFMTLAARLAGIPVVASFYQIESVLVKNWFERVRMRSLWRLALLGIDRVILPSEVARRNLGYLFRYPSERVTIISPGFTPPDDIEPPPREQLGLPEGPLVTMIPSREFDPGYALILDMLHRLLKRQPSVHLAIVGAGQTVAELQHKASSIRPSLPIRWLGERADLWDVIATSDVVIDCLSKENVPSSLVMAALVGKPIVAPRLLGTAEIIEPNVNGLLVTPGDTNDMAIQISRLLSYEGLSHRLGRMARRRGLERFSVEAQRKAITTLYESTIYTYR